jgi:hypothetical protein
MSEEDLVKKYDLQAGCSVDWAWLEGRKIVRAVNDLQKFIIEFEDGLTFKVQTLEYQGKPFLSFTPYKDPNTTKEESLS